MFGVDPKASLTSLEQKVLKTLVLKIVSHLYDNNINIYSDSYVSGTCEAS